MTVRRVPQNRIGEAGDAEGNGRQTPVRGQRDVTSAHGMNRIRVPPKWPLLHSQRCTVSRSYRLQLLSDRFVIDRQSLLRILDR